MTSVCCVAGVLVVPSCDCCGTMALSGRAAGVGVFLFVSMARPAEHKRNDRQRARSNAISPGAHSIYFGFRLYGGCCCCDSRAQYRLFRMWKTTTTTTARRHSTRIKSRENRSFFCVAFLFIALIVGESSEQRCLFPRRFVSYVTV